MSENMKENVISIITIMLGNFIIAAGVALFIFPLNILSGGVAGIAVALQPVFHLDKTLVVNVLTIGLYLVGAVTLGKKFALKTIASTFVYPFFITFLTTMLQDVHITENALLGSLYGGICIGIGIGLVYRVGGSTGGMDIPPLVINKYTGIPLPTLVMCIDGLTVILGASVYGVEAAMIGLISVWICGKMIDKVITLGGHDAKQVMIITEKRQEMIEAIFKEIDRGVTVLHAHGAYTNTEKPVIMVVVYKKQYAALNHVVTMIDPEAFMVVSNVNEVQGEGFTYQQEM
ncbi:YitT family protein [[Eubacterium] hominis]|uniref:YitT family protein n=1 Tax=[Eubacterium] hominis TaxID=2764325 RepID=UPI003A4DC721